MPKTSCSISEHTNKESKKYWAASGRVNAFGLITDSNKIFSDYNNLDRTKVLMQKAYWVGTPMQKLMEMTHGKWKYRDIYDRMTSYKIADSDYANKMQRAIYKYIWVQNTDPDTQFTYLSTQKIWQIDNLWETEWDYQLSDPEKQFIKDLTISLDTLISKFQEPWMWNIGKLMDTIVNHSVLWAKIEKKKNWAHLWDIIAVGTQQWVWTQNFLWLLWLFDQTTVELFDGDDQQVTIRVNELYSDVDEVMFNAWELLFVWEDDDNKPMMSSPKMYRQAIKQYMKKTEDQNIAKANSKLLQLWWFAKMTAPFLNAFAALTIGIQSAFTGYMNVQSYKKNHSKESINQVLDALWLNKEYFDWSKWKFAAGMVGTKQTQYTDDTHEHWLSDNPNFANLFVWPMNLLWDLIWKWQYVQIAMDKAMTRLGISGINDLYTVNSQGQSVLNNDLVAVLNKEFVDSLACVTGMQSVDWWWILNIFSPDKKDWLAKRLWKWAARIALQNFMFMKQWATNYVNKTLDILIWWTIWLIASEEAKDNAYKWPGGNWLIRRYTRGIEQWFAMPWEHAQALVSKKEYCQEISRLISWLRNAARLAWWRCTEEWSFIPNWACIWDTTAAVASLPVQAIQSWAHPLLQYLYAFVKDWLTYGNYFEDKKWLNGLTKSDYMLNSFIENFVKPFLKAEYLINVWLDTRMRISTLDEDADWIDYMNALRQAMMSNVNGMISYTSDQLMSYVYGDWAFWPKCLTSDGTTIFGWLNAQEYREYKDEYKKLKNAVSTQTDVWSRLSNITPLLRWISTNAKDWESFYWSEKTAEFLKVYAMDEWVQKMMMDWQFPEDMKDDPELMQYVWTHLTSDRQAYGAKFKDWIRDNEYNIPEILYTESVLKYDMERAVNANPNASDLEIYDAALRTFFENNPWYEQIKEAIQFYADNGETEMWVYTDYLANAWQNMETTGIKWLAIVAEYRKRQYMEQFWIQYSSNQTVEEKKALDIIENKVAEELGPYLWLADRREYNSIAWAYFTKKHPEYKDYDPFEWLYKDGKLKDTWDVKNSWPMGIALWMLNQTRQEMAMWSVNGYEMANVFTETFGSVKDKDWHIVPLKRDLKAFWLTYFDQLLDEEWYSPIERTYILAPMLTQDLDFLTSIINEDSDETKMLKDQLENSVWEKHNMNYDILQNTRYLIYDTYNAILDLPEVLDKIKDDDLVEKIFKKNTWGRYKPGWSLYSWNKTYPQLQKLNDYYKKPVDAFKNRWTKNLTKPISYGKSNYAWNYSTREFYFLNQRCYRNNINSDRIAPDIPLPIWWFSKDTVKSKNPVSWATTNIKPTTKPTARIGQSKGVVWWSKSRWPVTHFQA